MVGYWRWSAATAQTIDEAGWLRTGGAGYLDEDGYLYIHDRFKDMIVSGAENVYPAEVENAIYGHPAVQEVAVAFAGTRIAAFKAPKSVEFVAALPKGPSGKILRRVLREPYWKGRERRVN
jgi:long-chain acyl-CoA synthetase